MTREVDDFLADADDVIDDWEGSADAAAWSADGSHEYDTNGNYYLSQTSRRAGLLFQRFESEFGGVIVSDEAQVFFAPVASPLPRTTGGPLSRLASPAVDVVEVEVKIEVTLPDGAVLEVRVPRAQFTQTVTQDPHDDPEWGTFRHPRLPTSRGRFIVESIDGRYEIRDPRVASTDG